MVSFRFSVSLLFMFYSFQCLTASFLHGHDHKRSDDVSTASLQVLVQQQAHLIQSLQADLATTKNRLHALETSDSRQNTDIATLKTKQARNVAFTVRFAHDNGTVGIPLSLHQRLIFDSVVYNVGNGYNSRTGIFTAPVSGTYVFYLTLMSVNKHPHVNLVIVREGRTLDLVYAEGINDMNDQGSSEVTCHLAAGQQVWVAHNYGDGVRGSWYTVFTGFLIHAD